MESIMWNCPICNNPDIEIMEDELDYWDERVEHWQACWCSKCDHRFNRTLVYTLNKINFDNFIKQDNTPQ